MSGLAAFPQPNPAKSASSSTKSRKSHEKGGHFARLIVILSFDLPVSPVVPGRARPCPAVRLQPDAIPAFSSRAGLQDDIRMQANSLKLCIYVFMYLCIYVFMYLCIGDRRRKLIPQPNPAKSASSSTKSRKERVILNQIPQKSRKRGSFCTPNCDTIL